MSSNAYSLDSHGVECILLKDDGTLRVKYVGVDWEDFGGDDVVRALLEKVTNQQEDLEQLAYEIKAKEIKREIVEKWSGKKLCAKDARKLALSNVEMEEVFWEIAEAAELGCTSVWIKTGNIAAAKLRDLGYTVEEYKYSIKVEW